MHFRSSSMRFRLARGGFYNSFVPLRGSRSLGHLGLSVVRRPGHDILTFPEGKSKKKVAVTVAEVVSGWVCTHAVPGLTRPLTRPLQRCDTDWPAFINSTTLGPIIYILVCSVARAIICEEPKKKSDEQMLFFKSHTHTRSLVTSCAEGKVTLAASGRSRFALAIIWHPAGAKMALATKRRCNQASCRKCHL